MKLAATFFTMLFLGLIGIGIYSYIDYKIHIDGYLKRAADSSTIQLAADNLAVAVAEMEKRDMTEGTTRVLWHTPSRDVGFWYQNLHSSLQELQAMDESATPTDRSNMLIKLRETLLDHGERGDTVTHPPSIWFFPFARAYWAMLWVSALISIFIWLGVSSDAAVAEYQRKRRA